MNTSTDYSFVVVYWVICVKAETVAVDIFVVWLLRSFYFNLRPHKHVLNIGVNRALVLVLVRVELAKCVANPSCAANIACLQTCNNRPDETECQVNWTSS